VSRKKLLVSIRVLGNMTTYIQCPDAQHIFYNSNQHKRFQVFSTCKQIRVKKDIGERFQEEFCRLNIESLEEMPPFHCP